MSNPATKPAWKSPEFMAQIRQKSLAKRAETKKIKDAEKLILSKEREKKLKLADEVLNPKPVEPEPEPQSVVENTPLPKKKTTRRELDIDEPAPTKVSYKEEYYKRKLEMMERQQQAPTQPPPPPQNPAYVVAKHDIKQHVDRNVMKNLWSTYFVDTECPY